MSHINSQNKRWSSHRVYMLVLILATMGLGACVSQYKASSTSTSEGFLGSPTPIEPTPFPTKSPLPVESALPATKIPLPDDWPYRWLKGIPCHPPCWEGITPGQTTAEEAVEVLSRSPVIATVEIVSSPLIPGEGYVTWSWAGKIGGEGGQATFRTQTSSPILTIDPYYPATFRLGDVIQAYGEPSHIIARSYYGPDIDSGVFYDLGILYHSQGFVLIGGGRNKPTLSRDTLFGSVTFFSPNKEGLRAAFQWASAHPEWLVPWQGMQDFDFYCRDEGGDICP